ncbi:MAG TPA: preprotein translocase subunit SecY [Actinomycetota bacterium]|nr:preprotein translocase subunit SecY [Actinomycetota bacterium]
MLAAFVNAFKVPDLRKKIFFTVFIIFIYRVGSQIPAPGVDVQKALSTSRASGGVLGLLNLFSGSALGRLAVFALGILPYINASIMMQLLTVVIPKLEQWQKEGETGTKKINQWTRYLTVILALVQSTSFAFLFHRGGLRDANNNPIDLIPNFTPARVALIVLTLTAGTALVMWFGELITQRGIGNGMSILIFASIVSSLPFEAGSIQAQRGWGWFTVILALAVLIIVAIVIIEQGQRRIPIQYAKRQVGRRVYGGSSTYIPLKINQAGVIPIIFASALLLFPAQLATVIPWDPLKNWIEKYLGNPASIVYIILYGLLIVAFAYFYTAITFNPIDVADNMKKYGGYVPGIRPGRATADHLDYILTRITLPGALFIAAIALLPSIALATLQIQQLPFGGTSILITVGVALEIMKTLESQLMMRHYEGFLG